MGWIQTSYRISGRSTAAILRSSGGVSQRRISIPGFYFSELAFFVRHDADSATVPITLALSAFVKAFVPAGWRGDIPRELGVNVLVGAIVSSYFGYDR